MIYLKMIHYSLLIQICNTLFLLLMISSKKHTPLCPFLRPFIEKTEHHFKREFFKENYFFNKNTLLKHFFKQKKN